MVKKRKIYILVLIILPFMDERGTKHRALEQDYGTEITLNFNRSAQKKDEGEKDIRQYYSIVNSLICLLEYGKIFEDAINQDIPYIPDISDETLQADMDFSGYKTTTRLTEKAKKRLSRDWSRKIGNFPVTEKEMEKTQTLGELAERLFKKRPYIIL